MYAAVVSQLYHAVPHFYFLQECSVKGIQATWQKHFSLGFSAIYFTNTFYFAYYLLKSFHTQCNRSHIPFNLTQILGNGCIIVFNFPAKRLRKIRAPKIRMRHIFFDFSVTAILIFNSLYLN